MTNLDKAGHSEVDECDSDRLWREMWSMVSKAAERSRRQRHDTFCDPITLMRWSWMYSRAVSVEWGLQ